MVALITGITGQDGYYLAKFLNEGGNEVWGTTRSDGALPGLEFARLIQIEDIADQEALERAIATAKPDEIYHLAAQSSVIASWDDPIATAEITGLGTMRLLEAARRVAPEARVFVASSSEVFGNPERAPQDECTRIAPVSPYGAAKAFAQQMATIYRQHHGLFVAVGILYNHESPRRPESFVTQKIVRGAVAISRGEQTELRLGNLEARRDWGFAGDYVRAMHLLLQQSTPGDHVIATGESHSVREWCELAFAHVGLDYRDHVVSDAAFWRPAEPVPLIGDASKARRELGWSATTAFADLVRGMVEAERERIERPSRLSRAWPSPPTPSPSALGEGEC
jgi:GDPmannose 4,6-dehydratase